MYELMIHGTPAPMGSKTVNRKTRTMYDASKGLREWRRVMDRALTAYRVTHPGFHKYDGAVAAQMHFLMPRPKSHYRTGRFAHLLKDSAPREHTQKPDTDKLVRAVGDALTRAGFVSDDSVITRLSIEKRWAEYGEEPGVWLRLRGRGE